MDGFPIAEGGVAKLDLGGGPPNSVVEGVLLLDDPPASVMVMDIGGLCDGG